MSQQALEQIMARYESDAAFRAGLETDPVGTVEAAGIEVDAEVHAVLQQIEPGMSGEELRQRASKAIFPNPYRRM